MKEGTGQRQARFHTKYNMRILASSKPFRHFFHSISTRNSGTIYNKSVIVPVLADGVVITM